MFLYMVYMADISWGWPCYKHYVIYETYMPYDPMPYHVILVYKAMKIKQVLFLIHVLLTWCILCYNASDYLYLGIFWFCIVPSVLS